MKTTKLLLVIALTLLFSTPLLAKNNQTSVLGGGIGFHFFSEPDDTREGRGIAGSIDEVNFAAAYRLFAEWYPLGNFGIGILTNYQVIGRTYSMTDGSELNQQWSFGHYFGTINFIAFGGTSYARLGLYAGAGPATYSLKEEVSGTANNYNETVNVEGTATTFGIYGDWGGEAFGMRAGYQFINTAYPDMEVNNNSYEISSSGGTIHFDLRWAF